MKTWKMLTFMSIMIISIVAIAISEEVGEDYRRIKKSSTEDIITMRKDMVIFLTIHRIKSSPWLLPFYFA